MDAIETQVELGQAVWDKLLTVQQAALCVPCSVQTIRRAYLMGQLPVERFGQGCGRVRIRQRALEVWLKSGGKTQAVTARGGRDVSHEEL